MLLQFVSFTNLDLKKAFDCKYISQKYLIKTRRIDYKESKETRLWGNGIILAVAP